MTDEVERLYDELSSNYHRMFENWDTSIARQAAALAPLIEAECGPAAHVGSGHRRSAWLHESLM